jgi:hypothetical protein
MQGNNYPNAPGELQEQHRQDQAATGAAVGMMAGGHQARAGRRQAAAQQQQAAAAQQQKQAAWGQAYQGCMAQKGFAVPPPAPAPAG